MSRISKKKFWQALKKDPETEHRIFDMQIEDWITGYRRFRKQEDHELAMAEKLCEKHKREKKKINPDKWKAWVEEGNKQWKKN
jgi:hypothetical protein